MFRILLVSCCFLNLLWAHKINLFANDEQGVLHLYSYFTKSSPCKECSIKLLDKNDNIITTTMTNQEGKVSIALPKTLAFIIVDGSMGHQERIAYQVSTQEEQLKESLFENSFAKIIISLFLIAFFFGGMYWLKKKKHNLS